MTDKGEVSKDLEPEAITSEVPEQSSDSCTSPSRTADCLESSEKGNGSAMMDDQKMASPVTMTKSSSLEVIPDSPQATVVSSESAASSPKALGSTSSSGTSIAPSKSSETLRTAMISADDEDWTLSKFDSILHRYHNQHKKAKTDLEKIKEVILSDQDVLRNAVENPNLSGNFVHDALNSEEFRNLPQYKQIEMRRDLEEADKNLLVFLQIFKAEAEVDFENFKLLEMSVTKNLADALEYLKNAEVKAAESTENSSSSASKLASSSAVMWLNFAEKSLNDTRHDLHSFLMNRKLDYGRVFDVV